MFSLALSSISLAQDNTLGGEQDSKQGTELFSALTKIRDVMLAPLTDVGIEELLREGGLFDKALEEHTSFKDLFVIEKAIEKIFLIGHKLDYEDRTRISQLYVESMLKVEEARKLENKPYALLDRYMNKTSDYTLNDVADKLYNDLKTNEWRIEPEFLILIEELIKTYKSDSNKPLMSSNPDFYKLSPANLEMLNLFNEIVIFTSLRPGLGETYKNIDLNDSGFWDIKNNIKRTRSYTRNLRIK
jgi:hypothetical protein